MSLGWMDFSCDHFDEVESNLRACGKARLERRAFRRRVSLFQFTDVLVQEM